MQSLNLDNETISRTYESVLVYGVKESRLAKVISDNILKEFNLKLYTQSILNNYATNYIYGIQVDLNDILLKDDFSSIEGDGCKEDVDMFYGFYNFKDEPTFYLCIDGNFEILDEEYDDINDEENEDEYEDDINNELDDDEKYEDELDEKY